MFRRLLSQMWFSFIFFSKFAIQITFTMMFISQLINIQDLFNRLPVYSHHDFDVTNYLTALAGWSSTLGVIVALLLLFITMLLNTQGKARRFNVSGKFLTSAFILVWLAGFMIYDVGMYIGHSRWSLITNVPMAIIHAFEMFLLHSDVAAIHDQFHDNWIFMGCFSLVHLLAAFITLIFVIHHFGFNLIAAFRMFFEAYFFKSKKETFVFWGLNEPSFLLAKSIKQHYSGEEKKNYRIIIVRTNNDDKTQSAKNGMERLFNFMSLNDNDLMRLIDIGCLTTSIYTDLARLSTDIAADRSALPEILKKHIGLHQLSRIISKKTGESVHLFFLSDDSQANIQAVGNLKRDHTINEVAKAKKKAYLYCMARYNSVHRVIEDEQQHPNILVKVIDPSHISVAILKQTKVFHPANYVQIEKDATVSSAFNALIVGFDEVGHDVMRFLYEFGAFVKTGSDSKSVERSDFHCDIVDNDIKRKAGLFAVNAPAVSDQMSCASDNPNAQSLITLHELDVLSMDFYKYIESKIKSLNYVVIALDDDEQNVSLGVRIFRLAVRYRENMNRFRILVKVRDDKDGHLLRITEHYNRLWAAELKVDKSTQKIHQKGVGKNDKPHAPISLFGSIPSIFTYNYIVSDQLREMAKEFKKEYDKSISPELNDDTDKWEMEYRELMQLTDEYIRFSPTFSGIMSLRRKQRQNMENCFHKFTKQILAVVALDSEKYSSLSQLTREKNKTEYLLPQGIKPDDDVQRVLEVLAQTEHLRWMASHEILGYTDKGDLDFKDEARLQHGCLKPWNKLTEPVKSYDYNVVDVSLGINNH